MDDVQDIAARLGRAMVALRGEISQQQLVALLAGKVQNPAQNWISRREKGEVELKPSEIRAIECALEARPGTIYQLAGLVDPGTMATAETRSAINNDPLLTKWQRRAVIALYEQFVRVNAGEDDAS